MRSYLNLKAYDELRKALLKHEVFIKSERMQRPEVIRLLKDKENITVTASNIDHICEQYGINLFPKRGSPGNKKIWQSKYQNCIMQLLICMND